MKIAVIRKECTDQKGGAERYCLNLCRGLAEMGHEVLVLANSCDQEIHPQIRHVPIPVNSWSSSARNVSFHSNCQEALRHLRVDKVYALSRSFPADAFRVSDPLHSVWMRIRYPGWQHCLQQLNPRHHTIQHLERQIFHPGRTKAVITNSRLAKKQVLEDYRFPADRVHVVYNGVDLEKFTPREGTTPSDRKELVLLFVAHDFRRKGLAHLLEAVAHLRSEPFRVRLLVVGKDRISPFRKLAQKLDIDDRVEFLGPTTDVETRYRDADLLVCPTRYDPFANVCLEAMACGVPVVTTEQNGAAELIDEGKTGFVLPNDSYLSRRLAERIVAFARIPDQFRKEISVHARRAAVQFTVRKNVEETLEILSGLPMRVWHGHPEQEIRAGGWPA